MRGRYSSQTIDEYVQETRTISERKMHSLLEEFDIPLGNPRVVMKRGRPAATIAQFVKEVSADCVIMGTLSRSGIAGLLIGNTEQPHSSYNSTSLRTTRSFVTLNTPAVELAWIPAIVFCAAVLTAPSRVTLPFFTMMCMG